MANPDPAIRYPAIACTYCSSTFTRKCMSPFDARNTKLIIITSVAMQNRKVTNAMPAQLNEMASYMTSGMRGSQGPSTKTMKSVQTVNSFRERVWTCT